MTVLQTGELDSRDTRYSEYASGSQCTNILNGSGILICYSFSGYIDRVLNMPWVLQNAGVLNNTTVLNMSGSGRVHNMPV